VPPELTIDEREVSSSSCCSSGILVIPTDGSGYQGRIGAAAVITGSETVQRLSQIYTEMATVYADSGGITYIPQYLSQGSETNVIRRLKRGIHAPGTP
jgi:hypothetical protein